MVIERPMPSETFINEPRNQEEVRRVSQSVNYPKAVYFIIGAELFERLTYYGISTVLSGYLLNDLEIHPNQVTLISQIFMMFSYCFPLLGAILADSWLNKYRTILFMTPVYALGAYVLVLSSIPSVPGTPVAMTGLVITYIGLGGIRPCIVAFGGDQFLLPQQETHLKKYFSVFYFTINVGSFIADLSTQSLVEKVCFDEPCYIAAFGVVAGAITTCLIVFAVGKKYYLIRRPEINVFVKMIRCICHALKKRGVKIRKKSKKQAGHWLDKAADKYDQGFIEDVKAVLRILVLYSPLPLFRALFDQHGSRWRGQAARMSGDIGKLKIEASQMNSANSIFIILFIPLFEAFLYPAFARYNFLKKPLQRLTVGGLLAALAFVVSGLVETQLEPGDEYLPKPEKAQIRLFNGLPVPLSLEFIEPDLSPQVIPSLGVWDKLDIPLTGEGTVKIKYTLNNTQQTRDLGIRENALSSYLFMRDEVIEVDSKGSVKSKDGAPRVMLIYIQPQEETTLEVTACDSESENIITQDVPFIPFEDAIDCDVIEVEENGELIYKETDLTQGGVYVAIIVNKDGEIVKNTLTVVEPNSVHMLWLVPQYALITAGEVMFSITGFEFSYTQAPMSMKALLQAIWLLTAALGKVIVLSAGKTKLSQRLFSEFMLFAALMAIDMFVFAALAMRYTYVTTDQPHQTLER